MNTKTPCASDNVITQDAKKRKNEISVRARTLKFSTLVLKELWLNNYGTIHRQLTVPDVTVVVAVHSTLPAVADARQLMDWPGAKL